MTASAELPFCMCVPVPVPVPLQAHPKIEEFAKYAAKQKASTCRPARLFWDVCCLVPAWLWRCLHALCVECSLFRKRAHCVHRDRAQAPFCPVSSTHTCVHTHRPAHLPARGRAPTASAPLFVFGAGVVAERYTTCAL